MQYAIDLHGGHSRTAQRGQQNATKRVAERQAEAALEGFGNQGYLGTAGGGEFHLVRLDQFLPVLLDHH
ncbi:hypothetical protein D3C72_2432850 [compost metagenome]